MFGGKSNGSVNRLLRLKKVLRVSFKKIKEEMDQHLDTINANTNEIHSNYEYLCEMDSKIDKLNERIDDIEMMLKTIVNSPEHRSYRVQSLTRREQEIFFTLYIMEQENKKVTSEAIAQFLGLSPYVVKGYISNLIDKGVPINKNSSGERILLRLDSRFRELQAKKNIARINEDISKRVKKTF